MTAEELSNLFKEYGRTLGCAESFTGGSFAASITAIPGASKFFKGGIVSYATEEKIKLLGIDPNRVEQFGVVSQEIGGDMAMHTKYILDVDYSIAFTGNAGPDAMEGKPVGEIYIGVTAYQTTQVFKYLLKGSREDIVKQALQLGYNHLEFMIKSFK